MIHTSSWPHFKTCRQESWEHCQRFSIKHDSLDTRSFLFNIVILLYFILFNIFIYLNDVIFLIWSVSSSMTLVLWFTIIRYKYGLIYSIIFFQSNGKHELSPSRFFKVSHVLKVNQIQKHSSKKDETIKLHFNNEL